VAKKRTNNWVRWSEEELRLVKELYPIGKGKQIAEKTGRTLQAVKQKAYALGLGTRRNRRWSASEIKILKRLYPIEIAKNIADKLGRSEDTVRMKARSIGVGKIEPRLPWSKQEDALLRKLYPNLKNTRADIAEQIGRSINAVALRASRLGLKNRK
jgi:hypothetical protein